MGGCVWVVWVCWVVVRRSAVTGGVGRVASVSQASRVALPPRRLTVVSAVGPRHAHMPSPSSSSVSHALHVRALLRTAAMPSSPAGVSRTSPLHFAAHAALVSWSAKWPCGVAMSQCPAAAARRNARAKRQAQAPTGARRRRLHRRGADSRGRVFHYLHISTERAQRRIRS